MCHKLLLLRTLRVLFGAAADPARTFLELLTGVTPGMLSAEPTEAGGPSRESSSPILLPAGDETWRQTGGAQSGVDTGGLWERQLVDA